MKYKRFEDLPAWQAAVELGVRTFAMTGTGCLQGYSGLRDQLERAAVSVSNNIAEGFERGTHQELLTFLYYAKGSLAEVRSMLHLLTRLHPSTLVARLVAEVKGASSHLVTHRLAPGFSLGLLKATIPTSIRITEQSTTHS